MTKTIPLTITRANLDYELEVKCSFSFHEGTEGTLTDQRGWELDDYRIVSSELSGEVILTDSEMDQLLEKIS